MQLLSLKFAVLLAAVVPALGQTITTFANIGCSGDSAVFACDGSCQPLEGKYAFQVTSSTPECVSIFTDASCTDFYFPTPNTNGQCESIEAGDPTLSFSCDTTCVG